MFPHNTRSFCRRLALLLLACLLVFSTAIAETATPQAIRYFVDFDYAKLAAPDTVAWLYQPAMDINIPLVYSADRKHYLEHSYTGDVSNQGCLFFTGDTAPDFASPVQVLHGKKTLADSLFGLLYRYKEEEFYLQNTTYYLYTPEGDFQLDVFAGIRTHQSDTDSWMVDSQSPFTCLDAVLERSFVVPKAEFLPEEGDQWLLMTADGGQRDSARYVIYTRCRPIAYTGNETALELTEYELDSRENLNATYQVGTFDEWILYRQDDPCWDRMIFETHNSSRRRPFGDGGCGPTAIAMAVANLLPTEDLCKLNAFSPDPYGYTICTCSVTQTHCNRLHLPYQLDEAQEMLTYLPLAIGSFATGYNTLDVQGRYDRYGSSMDYLATLCSEVYGIPMLETTNKEIALSFLASGQGMAVTCTGGPPFTRNSHYLTLAGVDDKYLYILDPLARESYEELDPYGIVEILTPGVVRVTKHNAHNLSMSPIYLMAYPPAQESSPNQ